jgi:2-amino-4-hydroxy-6-hydroxymethyldihydropteridine diphosphokinase
VRNHHPAIAIIFIGIGSNIAPEENLENAAKELRNVFPEIIFSHVFQSDPLERKDQAPFLNAVARFVSEKSPEEVLRLLQQIESSLGKNVPFRFGPRTIDLDLLLYEGLILPDKKSWLSSHQSSLTLPHPRMHERRFVLEPLLEMTHKHHEHPVLHASFAELLRKVRSQHCHKTRIVL